MTGDGVGVPLTSAPSGADGRPGIYGIRPEHLALAGEGLSAEVTVVQPTGSETQSLRGGPNIVGVFGERVAARPGENPPIAPHLDAVDLFDEGTGKRLNQPVTDLRLAGLGAGL